MVTTKDNKMITEKLKEAGYNVGKLPNSDAQKEIARQIGLEHAQSGHLEEARVRAREAIRGTKWVVAEDGSGASKRIPRGTTEPGYTDDFIWVRPEDGSGKAKRIPSDAQIPYGYRKGLRKAL